MNYAKDITADYTASYAKYVATNRAVPSLVDGLKPVQRRCVNSANDLHLHSTGKFLKVAKLEGQVVGDYHPHGGASMTILAQPFKTRYPLFEGQGNWGSPDEPNSVAASRYIETRLTKFCEDFYLSSADYADREPNYDGRLQEVVKYYPPIPGVLLMSASGIAVGISTEIPPHRVSDVCRSLKSYITGTGDYKDLYPETCEQSIIMTPKGDIRQLYETGECSIQYKAKTHYESIDGKLALVVDAFPPNYSKKRLETSFIMDAVESGDLDLRNESSTGIRYVFISANKDILTAVEERLVSSVGYRMYIENNDQIHLYKLNEIYDEFIESRKGYIIRKYTDLLQKNEKEIEFLRVLLEFKKDKEYIKTIFDKDSKVVISEIMSKYSTDRDTASRVISSSLSSLMKDNESKLLEKKVNLESEIENYRSYIDDPILKILLDIDTLYDEFKDEERRAIHIDDLNNKVKIKYNGDIIESEPSDLFYVGTFKNEISIQRALEVASMDLTDKILVADGYEYYVLYDNNGLVAITKDRMRALDNKFNSTSLVGIIGTNDLSKVKLHISNKKKVWDLGEWCVKSRLSYMRQADEGERMWLNYEE